MNNIRHLTLFIILSLSFSCCAGPIITSRQDPSSTLRSFRQDILSSETLSPDTLQALRMSNFTQKQSIEEGFDSTQKSQFEKYASRLEQLYIENELAIARAKYLHKSDLQKSLGLYLLGARLSTLGLELPECRGPFDLRCDSFKVFYAASIAPLVEHVIKNKATPYFKFETGVGVSFNLNLLNQSKLEDPSFYDTIVPSDTIGLEGLTNRHRRHGIGLAITGCRNRRTESVYDSYLPRVGTCLPLTALISFRDCESNFCPATLELHNALTHEEAKLHGMNVPLAADFTAPFASIIEKTGLSDWDGLFSALNGSEELLKDTGFYTIEPFDPNKIPIITVHGLFSSPLTWLQVHNDLMGDPVLRRHYQIWHYLYPTNLALLINARTFREKFIELHNFMEPISKYQKGDGHMVVISHSMGGILTHLNVIPDSQPLKNYFFTDPDKISMLEPETRKEVDSLMTFSRLRGIKRAIFVAVPHRGSEIADDWIGSIGRWLISIPRRIVTNVAHTANEIEYLMKPEVAKELKKFDYSSIGGLSKKNPTLLALDTAKIDPSVPYHSIIGDRGKGDTPNSSDGVVQYSSSHLEGAISEVIVAADHTAHVHPLAIAELRRILREHIDIAGIEK